MTRSWLGQPSEKILVTSRCPLRAASFTWRTADGRRALTVVCKATYDLFPGTSPLAQAQDEILAEDVHWQGDPRNSLRAPSDLVPFKPRADILITGHVYPPSKQRVRSLVARVSVSTVDKAIAVHGDRCFLPNGQLTPPAELTRVPLSWERAAGGPGTINPVGVQPASRRPGGGASWAPTFQPLGAVISNAYDAVPPVGFGPIAPRWPNRTRRLGRAAASWDPMRWPLEPIPENFDVGYFNSAPPDQQADHLAPDERIELEHLHPEVERLVTRLQTIVPRAVVQGKGRPEHVIELRCDTLWIDTDRGVCCLTWRGSIAFEMAEGAEILITADSHVQESSAAERASKADAINAAPATVSSKEDFGTGTVTVDLRALMGPAPLPFSPAAVGAPSIATPTVGPPEPCPPNADPTGTLVGSLVAGTFELPLGWNQSRASAAPVPSTIAQPPTPIPSAEIPFVTEPIALPAPVEPAAEPFRLESELFGLPPPAIVARHIQTEGSALDAEARQDSPPPPAMLGAAAAASSVEPAQSEPAAPTINPEAFGLERWAQLSAELDHAEMSEGAPRKRTDVLRDNDVLEVDWLAVDPHWKQALEREAERGGFALRFRFDAAYVAAIERLRGRPITASDYAKILAAGERSRVLAVLGEQGMPAGAHLPIMRQWTGKIARDPKLSLEMLKAVAAVHEGAAEPSQMASSTDRGA